MTSDAQIALTGSAEYEKKRVENQTQINLLQDLQKYMQNEGYEVLPSNIGLQDVNLAAAINLPSSTKYALYPATRTSISL